MNIHSFEGRTVVVFPTHCQIIWFILEKNLNGGIGKPQGAIVFQ